MAPVVELHNLETGTHITIPAPGACSSFADDVSLSYDQLAVSCDSGAANEIIIYENSNGWTVPLFAASSLDFSFGNPLVLSGQFLFTGTPSSLSVRMYQRNEGGADAWGLSATASSLALLFGTDVDMSDCTLLTIESLLILTSNLRVFDLPPTSAWTILALIEAGDVNDGAISGSYAAMGDPSDNANLGGSVFIFMKNLGGRDLWSLVKTLPSPFSAPGVQFGFSVSLYNDDLIVGAPNGIGGGQVFVYQRDMGGFGNWGLRQTITSTLPSGSSFGSAVGVHAQLAVIGAPNAGLGSTDVGQVSVYQKVSGFFELVQDIPCVGLQTGALFGTSVAVYGDIVVVGAPLFTVLQPQDGAVLIYERDTSASMTLLATETTSTGAVNSRFGEAVAVHSTTVMVGAPDLSQGLVGNGGVEFFKISDLAASEIVLGPSNGSGLGSHVAITDGFALAASSGDDTVTSLSNKLPSQWSSEGTLPGFGGAGIGSFVSMDAQFALVGHSGETEAAVYYNGVPLITPSPSVTSIPSLTATASPSLTALPSLTPTISLTPLPSLTPSVSLTPLPSLTPSISITALPSLTSSISLTPLPSITASISLTPIPSITASISLTALPSITASITLTATSSLSFGASISPTPTISTTTSVTATISETSSPSDSSSASTTNTATASPTSSISVTPTKSVTGSNTPPVSITPTSSPPLVFTVTASVTPTLSLSTSLSPSVTGSMGIVAPPLSSPDPYVQPSATSTPVVVGQAPLPSVEQPRPSGPPRPLPVEQEQEDNRDVIVEVINDNDDLIGVITVPGEVFPDGGTIVVNPVDNPSETGLQPISPIFDITIFDRNGDVVRSFGRDLEICIATPALDQADDICLGFFDEGKQEFVCEDPCVEEEDDQLCGTTDHLTSFALLLGGGEGGTTTCDGDDGTDLLFTWLSIAFISAALVIVIIALVIIEIKVRRKFWKKERGMRNMTRKVTSLQGADRAPMLAVSQ
mmetsp:Transcript_855/g.3125  ORF Transcript_855/g.3125 Transcript_855/m.3125 type:complete len:983 (-) Transcript_855:50-2998(-)